MDIQTIPFGEIGAFQVFIEIPQGSRNKYELDESSGLLKLDFVLSGEISWPYNYGFICGTRGGDGDMLDAVVFSSEPLASGTVAVCRAVAMAEVIDRGEVDNKILCIPLADRAMSERYTGIDSFSEEQLLAFEDFLQELAVQKNKIVELKGFRDRDLAEQEILRSLSVSK